MNTRKVKQMLAMVLAVIMLVAGLPMAVSAMEYKVGDIIQFGSYPQTRVTDSGLISKLNAANGTWKSYGYMSGAGTRLDDGSAQPSDYMKYKDVTVDGNRYRAVKFSTYRKYITNYKSDTSINYTWQETNGYYINTTYWFKFEPLDWRVLDPQFGLVICEDIIDSQPYSNTMYRNGIGPYGDTTYLKDAKQNIYANNYAESSIRAWLNDIFYYTAFSSSDHKNITAAIIDNKAYSSAYSQYDSATTSDKVFLLKYYDVINTDYGFNASYSNFDINRRAAGSDYAKCQGLYICDGTSDYSTVDGRKTSYWWLRSAGDYSSHVTGVGGDGYTDSHQCIVNDTRIGVRPAIIFNINKINLKTYKLGESTYSFRNYVDNDATDGHCFGMSSTSSFYYLGLLNYPSQTPNTYSLPDNSTTRNPICTYMAIQGSYRDKAMVAGGYNYEFKQWNIKSDWKEVINYVKDHSHDGKGDLQIGFRKKDKGGHAINFLRYENIDGQDRIYAYDNNEPNRETYFYKAEDGNIYQAVYSTFSGSIDCITLRNMHTYFENARKYQKKNAVYSSSDSIMIENAEYSPMDMGNEGTEYYMYELPDDITEVEIKPLKDNAEFRYMDKIYTFSEVDENTMGVLKLAESDDEEAVQQIEFKIEGAPEKPTEPSTDPTTPDTPTKCTCKCHSSGFSLFIWKIGNFFHKIFGMNQYRECPCGKKMHW